MRKPETNLRIGHISLVASDDWPADAVLALVASVQDRGPTQFLLSSDEHVRRRAASFGGVVVGPTVRSPLSAYCLVPRVDLVHAHDLVAGQTGLLLTLTRSVPYVLSHVRFSGGNSTRLCRAIYRRAAAVICRDDAEVAILRHFDPALRIERIPACADRHSTDAWLRIYQNSQRMPMAGNSGSQ